MNLLELLDYFAKAATSTSGPLPDLDRVFTPSTELTASERLSIYNRGYHYRLLGALDSVFPSTRAELGDQAFERMGLEYLARNPSEQPAIEQVGRNFPAFLRASSAVASDACDLAALEWERLCALVAPDPSHLLRVQDLDSTTFPRARLQFVKALSTLVLGPRALRLFQGQKLEVASNSSAPGEIQVGVAVWRQNQLVLHETLDPPEFEALRQARAGASVAEFCAAFASHDIDTDAARAFRAVSGWFARQWLEQAL